MTEGSKWELYIPQELAYGKRGSMPTIQPYSALVFEVELFEVVKPAAKK
jgi:FKBP-type peptidyl-prolyl cis-trans isomerase FklB